MITRGSNPEELTQLIKKDFNTSYSRADSLVRTELSHIYNTAALERYREAGCAGFEWVTAGDERTCAECADMNHHIFSFGEDAPPLHPNCLCTIIPVIGDGETGTGR